MHADPAEIRLLVLDVDGVLTDGRIFVDHAGREIKVFHVRDGFGLRAWLKAGNEAAIVTGRRSQALSHRARELGIRFLYQGSPEKWADVRRVMEQLELRPEQTAMVGDDLPDLSVMRRVGYPVAVADACEEIRSMAAYVAARPGGAGAVREVVEHLLKARGAWASVIRRAEDAP